MSGRSRTARLTPTAIIESALDIADHEGLEALSMRRLAQKLNCAAMSLYEYFDNKEQLLDLIADHAIASLPEVDRTGDWRAQTIRFYRAMHALFLVHPAVAHILVERTVAGPNTARTAEPLLATLVAAGLSDRRAVDAFLTLTSYTIGASLHELARTGNDRANIHERFSNITREDYPTLHRLAPLIVKAPGDKQFRSGLVHLLDSYDPRQTAT